MVQNPPGDLAFLSDLLRRYPVQVAWRGVVLPEGPLRGEKLLEEGEAALYWTGSRPPSPETLEALRLLLKAFQEVLALRERELSLLRAQDETARLLRLLLHEIKNPLMSVLGALELTLGTEGLPEEAKELLGIAERSARRIQELLQKAQEYLRLGQGVRLRSERVDLKALLRQAAEEVRPLARRKGLALRLILPGGGLGLWGSGLALPGGAQRPEQRGEVHPERGAGGGAAPLGAGALRHRRGRHGARHPKGGAGQGV